MFESYKKAITRISDRRELPASERFELFKSWYSAEGRSLFLKAFEHETGERINLDRNIGTRFEIGLPTSFKDIKAKLEFKTFYTVHAELFILEIDRVFRADGAYAGEKTGLYYSSICKVVKGYLFDSMALLEEWGTYHAGVPGVYGVWRASIENSVHLYHAAWQAIFGNHSPLSSVESHPDTAIMHIRMNVELRIRHGFGIIGKVNKISQGFEPIVLSLIMEIITGHLASIEFAVPFSHIDRIYRWANLYMHAGYKMYSWCAPAALDYLRPILMGKHYEVSGFDKAWSLYGGIRTSKETLKLVQDEVRVRVGTEYELVAWEVDRCNVLLM